jgi:hypothetical protein
MNQSRLITSVSALLVGFMLPAPAAPLGVGVGVGTTFDLVTASEVNAWNTVRPKDSAEFSTRELRQEGVPSCHSIPDNSALAEGNPQIKILAPALGKPLIAPIDIDLQFVPAGVTAIRPETFRVCYMGFLTVDITKRITDRITVSAQGLHVAGAQLPQGHHHLMMLIADQQGHMGRREATFDIQ